MNLCRMKSNFRSIFLYFSKRGFNDVLDERRSGKNIWEDSVLSVSQDERVEFNVEVRFLKLTLMKLIFEIGTISLFCVTSSNEKIIL